MESTAENLFVPVYALAHRDFEVRSSYRSYLHIIPNLLICRHPEFELNHQPYIDSLPDSSSLRTPLHFTEAELAVSMGSNLYGATIERENEWRNEWTQCHSAFSTEFGDAFSWSNPFIS